MKRLFFKYEDEAILLVSLLSIALMVLAIYLGWEEVLAMFN